MREIKFKGKRKDNGTWVFGYLFNPLRFNLAYILEDCSNDVAEDTNYSGAWSFPEDLITSIEVDIKTVAQYTGLHDKNGKEIYEGDILKLWRSVGAKGQLRGEYYYPLPVEYCEAWTQFVAVDKANKIQHGIFQEFGAFEVIGNIYENPELLGGV